MKPSEIVGETLSRPKIAAVWRGPAIRRRGHVLQRELLVLLLGEAVTPPCARDPSSDFHVGSGKDPGVEYFCAWGAFFSVAAS